ncbi:MAG: GTP-binding protein [Gammaproteobacteria bacterium]|jgi:GTP-binding protein
MAISFQQAQFLTSAFELNQLPPDEGFEIAFAGRSNAGKSSAINCLTRQKNLCKTSKTPGRTQLINFFPINAEHTLVDLPGYGYAKVSKQLRSHWNQVLTSFLLERRSLCGLIIVVDIRRGISDMDQALIELSGSKLPLHILLTKSDKLSKSGRNQVILDTEKMLDQSQSVSALSIVTKSGLEDLEKRLRSWFLA